MGGVIGFDNFLVADNLGNISASGAAQGFEEENVSDWRTNNAWQAVAFGSNFVQISWLDPVSPNAFGIFRHNFNDGGFNIGVQYFDSTWQDVDYPLIISPGVPGVIFGTFTQQTSDNWRLLITSASAIPTVGHFFLGTHISFKSQKPPFSPARYFDSTRYKTQISETGQFLGRTFQSAGAQTSIGLDLIQPGELENTWEAFLTHAKSYPFYYSWDIDNHPEECAYVWTRENRPIRARYYRTPQFMRFNAQLEARIK